MTAIALSIQILNILALPSLNQMNEKNLNLQNKIAELERQKKIIDRQEQFLRSIYENVREAIFVVDVEEDNTFRYQGFNPAAVSLTGIENIENKTPEEIFPPEVASTVIGRYQKCVYERSSISYEECLPFKGENTWWLTTLNPIEDEKGNIHRIVGTSLNINDRKQVEMELDKDKKFLQTLLDNLSDGIVSCDENGILTLFNRATQEFHGLPQQSIPPNEWAEHYDLYLPDGETPMTAEQIPLFRALEGESVRDVEMMIIPKQGKPRILLANGDPIVDRNGKKIGAIAAMRDITERRQAEIALARLNSELEKLNNELENRVKQRTNQLERVNALLLATTATLEKRNEELDRFAYVTSHDLKAPLRAIANLSEWIEEDLEDKLDDDTRHNMNLLRGRVYRLENLINGLLDYSRVGRLNTELQTVNVTEMLAEIIDLQDIPSSCKIIIDRNMPTFMTQIIPLQQIFRNLIGNAIEHGESSQITISVRELAEYYEFAVSDNGKGIDPQYHKRIFDIFQTLESRDAKESTGIGLAIVKKAVENQGGEVSLESVANQGCTFKFTWRKSMDSLSA